MFKRKTKEEITVSSSMRASSLHVAYIATGRAEKESKITFLSTDRSAASLINLCRKLSTIYHGNETRRESSIDEIDCRKLSSGFLMKLNI